MRFRKPYKYLPVATETRPLKEHLDYVPVEIQPRPDVPSAGVFQLQQVNICMAYETALVV
jgi:hypothetical protein